MAAVPAFHAPARLSTAEPGHLDVAAVCRRLAGHSDRGVADDAALVDALRYLEGCLHAWRQSRLERAAASPVEPAPPPLAVGTFARAFAAWLDAHPQRANEPLERLLREALQASGGGRPD